MAATRALMVAASSAQEKQRWLDDLNAAIDQCKTGPDQTMSYLSLKSISASDEVLDASGAAGDDAPGAGGRRGAALQPSNSSVHVCWHRATSVHYSDYVRAAQNQLSGYLLRKFKNSMGWQKLWVVFTNFCLFFYKTFQSGVRAHVLAVAGGGGERNLCFCTVQTQPCTASTPDRAAVSLHCCTASTPDRAALSLQQHASAVQVLWQCCGSAVAVLWQCCASAVAVLWQCCASAVAVQ
ncbi:FERM, ARHGEF and pleckstrin domain-containing protein 2 [Hyalella azteca]|uniref:FERM, ARHGEF and pleckstrin domain-containing protein 2 n=1 Tax=Hyalella azteca TaxID=294128 RepID=A0A8B7NRT4_HYAAZ|nr:FERM, ARHGEF and pleckstrin domain-containing protein 2 [Hyalella azteca]